MIEPVDMPRSKEAKGLRGGLALFTITFFLTWTLCVVLIWKLELLPQWARPWFRTFFWIAAAAAFAFWVKLRHPLRWLGVTPVSTKAIALSLLAFVSVLGWNFLRVNMVDVPLGRISALSLGGYAWSLVGVFVEELLFRGVVQTRLSEQMKARYAIPLAAALFLTIHFPGWLILSLPFNAPTIVSVFLIGLVCGCLRYFSGSLWPAVTAHWANNLGALL
ncbi:CPBP family intramembrane metalloprotease [Microvirga sp. ACRRW]|uniref:CPBP family intramembrane glutamic endopeptidase n=1 Tax=Microvirga sp. ACRRW TaxID=2918205 RepID=UPI001EF51D4C|nr:type II CAAX endopeptidase family protein [Microvirga sp. ACRRW]MCG7391648.1 CPBP family intramembrane metalloprotease [Microvirga sp. ACRRW]